MCNNLVCIFTGSRKNQVQCQFQHRMDCLESRVESTKIGEVTESFAPGRSRALKGTSCCIHVACLTAVTYMCLRIGIYCKIDVRYFLQKLMLLPVPVYRHRRLKLYPLYLLRAHPLWEQSIEGCQQNHALPFIVSVWSGAHKTQHSGYDVTYVHLVYLFYSARVDCLFKREFTATEMIEHFKERPDFLHYRHTTYHKVPKSRSLDAALNKDTSQKPILKIVERFRHNHSIPPNSDVAERVFLLDENKIRVSYHLEKDRITPSTREYIIPQVTGDQGYNMHFDPDMTTAFQVRSYSCVQFFADVLYRVLYSE